MAFHPHLIWLKRIVSFLSWTPTNTNISYKKLTSSNDKIVHFKPNTELNCKCCNHHISIYIHLLKPFLFVIFETSRPANNHFLKLAQAQALLVASLWTQNYVKSLSRPGCWDFNVSQCHFSWISVWGLHWIKKISGRVAQHNQAISYCLGNNRAVTHPMIVYIILPHREGLIMKKRVKVAYSKEWLK